MQTHAATATVEPAPQGTPGPTDPVARATGLRPLLAEDAAEADRARRLTDRVVDAVTDAGLMRLMTPPGLGGAGTGVRTLLDTATELGRGCASTAWVTGVLNVGNFVASLFPEAAQEEVWGGNPDARTAQVLGVPAKDVEPAAGGVRVTGRWAYMSGSLHADWVGVLLARGPEDGAPGVHFALIPRDELALHDTWQVVGMRGTGSNTMAADRVFVPEHRLLPYLPVLNGELTADDTAAPHRNSLTGVFSLGLLGSLIGGAKAAFDYVSAKAPERPAAGSTYPDQAASPTTQLALAEAATMIDTAQLHARRIADTVDEHALTGSGAETLVRARSRMDSAHVAQLCRSAVDTLITAYGSSAFAETSPLQRIWRDVHVGSRHAGFGMGIPQQVYGRALVGGDPRDISLLV
ncbi:acyl-CoA dehydrogenase family protein [Nocardiopsis halophila]|uniref:acyl-CoA dehydrogenase family protein n=1 Tax=Nocardiopsis halophila TaxID=141692 RepID=UPI00034ADC65|nr:acyl-CoA dehydrogenase family protein [Nocardiopsis halophila]